MSKFRSFTVGAIALLVFVGTVAPAEAALTGSQIQAILSLLSSFGADAITINNVNAALTGQPTVPTPTPTPIPTPIPTSTPTPIPPAPSDGTSGGGGGGGSVSSCSTLTRTLSRGDTDIKTNGEVSALQGFLTSYFNLSENIVVGSYGRKTVQYVKQFQAKNGLDQVGNVGKLTRAAIARVCGGMTIPPPPMNENSVSCSIWPAKESYVLGETITFNWTSKNASYAGFVPDTSGKDNLWVPGDKLPVNGSQEIKASVLGRPSVTLAVYGQNNSVARCTATVGVTESGQSITITAPNEAAYYSYGQQLKVAWRSTGSFPAGSVACVTLRTENSGGGFAFPAGGGSCVDSVFAGTELLRSVTGTITRTSGYDLAPGAYRAVVRVTGPSTPDGKDGPLLASDQSDQYFKITDSAPTTFDSVIIATEITPPAPLIASPRNGSVFLQWVDNVIATDHVVEYKQSSASTWNTFFHSVSSVAGITVTGLTNGTSYDFRVSTISSAGQSDPTVVSSITPSADAIHASNNQILSTGQSLSVGYNGGPALTTTQPYSNLMLNAATTSLIALIEPARGASGAVETMSSALANMITSLASSLVSNYTSIVSLHGVSSAAYSGLKKGTAPYNYGMAQVSAARQLSLAVGKSLIVSGVTAIHGERDELAGRTASRYEADLVEWQNDYETDVQVLLGQQDSIPLFTDQMSSWTAYNSTTPHTALGQYMAAKDHPDDIIVVAPKYMLDYSDTVHLTNYSYRRLGEYYAKAYKKVVIDGDAWTPLMPTAVERSGSTIRATFAVPVEPLALDTTAVNLKTNYGFEYTDDSSSATISSVEIIAPDAVQVTLSGTPTGANPRLRYAYTGTSGSGAGRTVSGSARGNLRDSDTTAALYQDGSVPVAMGNYLYNWALTFDEAVEAVTIPDAPFRFASSTSGTLGTYQFFLSSGANGKTANISQADALANCKLNANSNPTQTIRCTWNGIEIYNNATTTPPTTPSIDKVSISSSLVKADGMTPYTITVTGSDPSGGGNVSYEYALINFQGDNGDQTKAKARGYLSWYYGSSGWAGLNPITCTGTGGVAVKQNDWGNQYVNLISCTSSVSGNTRTVTFTVTFNPSFTAPLTNNDISGRVYNIPGNIADWKNFDINFGLTPPPETTSTPTTTASVSSSSQLASVISAMQTVLDGLKNQLNQLTGR
ncbi:MAG: peptidoglycan-binding protein [bacterium]|nr:peptidoglycan-binding protein [bacterium]